MTYPLDDKFHQGPISQIPREWFESVARILNYIEGVGCRIEKSADPSESNPWKIIIDDGGSDSVPAHAPTHKVGGSDEIAIDELGAASDNTNLNVSDTAHGLTPKLPTADGAKLFLRGDGSWGQAPGAGTTEGQLLKWDNTATEWKVTTIEEILIAWLNPSGTTNGTPTYLRYVPDDGSGHPGFEWEDIMDNAYQDKGLVFSNAPAGGSDLRLNNTDSPPNGIAKILRWTGTAYDWIDIPGSSSLPDGTAYGNVLIWQEGPPDDWGQVTLNFAYLSGILGDGAPADNILFASGSGGTVWRKLDAGDLGSSLGQWKMLQITGSSGEMDWVDVNDAKIRSFMQDADADGKVLTGSMAGQSPTWEDMTGVPAVPANSMHKVLQINSNTAGSTPVWDYVRAT